jgi:hypothetical protein
VVNILDFGTEDIDFTATGTVAVQTGSTRIRTSFVRSGMQVSAAAVADPPGNRITSRAITPAATLWVHVQFSENTSNATTSNAQMVRVLDGSGVCRLIVRGTGTAGQLKISKRTSAGVITDLVTGSSGAWANSVQVDKLDLFINYAVAGQASLYIDGTLVADFSGDVTTDSATSLAQVEFASPNTTNNVVFSEYIMADGDTRGMAYYNLNPVAAGNTQGWTPNTVGNINETTLSDATIVSTSTNNTLSEWTTPTSLPSGSWAVRAVTQSARVQIGTTGPQHFDWVVRTIDGTDNLAGASVAPSTSFSNFAKIWNTNPQTATAWATSDIASGFNLGIKSLA